MDIKGGIISALKEALEELGLSGIEPQLEHPQEESHGDCSANVAMEVFGKVSKVSKAKGWKTPLKLAEAITGAIRKTQYAKRWLEKIEAAPPGFINFWLSKEAFGRELEKALKEGERYPSTLLGTNLKGRRILVEFAHPNTHKLFHIGHLRNITLGESICRLLESQQARVNRANYQGDIGLHIAKALWGLKTFGGKQPRTLDGKVRLLARAYVKGNEGDEGGKKEIEEINKKLYEGDKKLAKLWEETRKWSLEYFDQIYKRVGTKFDRLYFESEVAEPGRELVRKNINKVFKEDQGAVIFPGEKYGLHNRVFINSLGLPTYEAKDIGLAKLQLEEFSPDRIIHVVGPEQKGYFEVVFKAIELVIPALSGREYHLAYGWVRLKTGKMSSRTGDVVEGEWLLDEVKKRLREKYEMADKTAEQVAVGAVKYSMLRLHPQSEIAFDIDESIRLDGESGPYLQYTFARTQSVLEKSRLSDVGFQTSDNQAADSEIWQSVNRYLKSGNLNSEELALLRHFYKFPEVVQESAEKFSPNLLCNFLFELCQRYNAFYGKHRILGQAFRLALTEVTGNILKTGLGLLGIESPKRM